MNALGNHVLIELYGCDPDQLNDMGHVRQTMLEAAQKVNATIIDVVERSFEPQGVTVIVAIAESHLSIHTWPEHQFAAVDVFSCVPESIPGDLVDFFVRRFDASNVSSVEIRRGIMARSLTAVGAVREPSTSRGR